MFLRYLKDCREFTAGDDSILRELLHPAHQIGGKKTPLQIHYSLAHAEVRVGQMTKPHKLQAAEVYYIICGQGLIHINEESLEVGPDCAVYIPPQALQYIENTGVSVLKFLCIVDPAWRKEDEEVFDIG